VNASAFHLDSPKAYINDDLKFSGKIDTRTYEQKRAANRGADITEALELSS
jgi:hypothetical protein